MTERRQPSPRLPGEHGTPIIRLAKRKPSRSCGVVGTRDPEEEQRTNERLAEAAEDVRPRWRAPA